MFFRQKSKVTMMRILFLLLLFQIRRENYIGFRRMDTFYNFGFNKTLSITLFNEKF